MDSKSRVMQRLGGRGSKYPLSMQTVPMEVALLNGRDPAAAWPGAPPGFGQPDMPHIFSFVGRYGMVANAYQNSDEALLHNSANAEIMRNEPMIMECVEARMRCVALLNWHIQPVDHDYLRDALDKADSQEAAQNIRRALQKPKSDAEVIADKLTSILKHTPHFMKMRYSLMDAIWYGKTATVQTMGSRVIGGKRRIFIRKWEPRHGDKLVFRYADDTYDYDPDQIGIRIGPSTGDKNDNWTDYAGFERQRIDPTQHGLVYWFDGQQRKRMCLHKHIIEDGDFMRPEKAGAINGVGIRSRIYWTWWAYQESLKLLMEYIERSALGIEIWKYPAHDPQAKARTEQAAKERGSPGRSCVLVPVPTGEYGDMYGVEIVEPGLGGIGELQNVLQTFFGHKIKRYILGQTLTSEADATGLGSGVADAHLATFHDIVRFDGLNLEETMTNDLLRPMQLWNFPGSDGVFLRFVIDTESPDAQERIAGYQAAWAMGLKIRTEDMYDALGAAPPADGEEFLDNPGLDSARLGNAAQQMQMQQMQMQMAMQQPQQVAMAPFPTGGGVPGDGDNDGLAADDNAQLFDDQRGDPSIAFQFDGKKERYAADEFKEWFGKSHVVDESGSPLRVYRGQHGTGNDLIHSKRGAVSFSKSPEVAGKYASVPNDSEDQAKSPHSVAAYLRIANPFMNTPDDPFIDGSHLAAKLGHNEAKRILNKFATHVENTNNWQDEINGGNQFGSVPEFIQKHPNRISELAFDAYRFFDDADEVNRLKGLGYDGAIHCGTDGGNDDVEYKVFDKSSIRPAIGRSVARNQFSSRVERYANDDFSDLPTTSGIVVNGPVPQPAPMPPMPKAIRKSALVKNVKPEETIQQASYAPSIANEKPKGKLDPLPYHPDELPSGKNLPKMEAKRTRRTPVTQTRSSVPLMDGSRQLNFENVKSSGQVKSIDISRAHDLWSRSNGGILDINNENDLAHCVDAMVEDTAYAFKSRKGRTGWYDKSLKRAMKFAAQKFPELRQNPELVTVMKLAMAVASGGTDVMQNYSQACKQFHHYLMHGRFDEQMKGGGEQQGSIRSNFKLANHLLEEHSIKELRNLLLSKKSVSAWKQLGYKMSGEKVTEEVYGSNMFGAKIGAFFANLHGKYDPVTMDRWFMRTVNRLRGTMATYSVKGARNQAAAIYNALLHSPDADESLLHGYTRKQLMEDALRLHRDGDVSKAKRLVKWASKRYKAFSETMDPITGKSFGDKSHLNNSARNLHKNVGLENLKPNSSGDRSAMRKLVNAVQVKLKKQHGIEISNAELQALLWYHEKSLFTHLGYRSPGRGESLIAFDDAAKKHHELDFTTTENQKKKKQKDSSKKSEKKVEPFDWQKALQERLAFAQRAVQ